MADRKVLVKYYPKNFDPQLLVKRGRGKDKLMMVRNMLPMSLRCNTCSNYLYIGTKFNMRLQICNDETYLGIKVFRFYLKCTYCYNDITFKTDPKNHDYVVELGGTRNYQPIRDAQQAQKLIKKMKKDQKDGDSMKFLENRTYDSKRQMELNQALEDIKSLNKRQAIIDPQDLLKNMLYQEIQDNKFTQEQQLEIDKHYQQLRKKLNSQKFQAKENYDSQMIKQQNQVQQNEDKLNQFQQPIIQNYQLKQNVKIQSPKQDNIKNNEDKPIIWNTKKQQQVKYQKSKVPKIKSIKKPQKKKENIQEKQ